MNFFAELKRRSVYKVGAAYVVVAWLLIQVATQTFPFFEIPNWVVRAVILLLCLGFPVALVMAWVFDLTPDGWKRTGTEEARPSRRGGRAWIYIVVLGTLLSVALFFAGRYTAPDKRTRSADRSLAVLPFENLSEDKANAYFADGMQDEIITRLAKIGALKVISRSSTERYRVKTGNVAEIGRELGVAHLVEGSVQKVGERVRINVQLIDARNDEHLWAELYDRNLTDIFAVQSEVATAIARRLEARLSGREEKAVADRPTDKLAAYDAYLRGLDLDARPGQEGEVMKKAADTYAEAVRLDPNFAKAWAALSQVNAALVFNRIDVTAAREEAARAAAERATRLDPDSAETLLANAYVRYHIERDFGGARLLFEKLHEQVPSSSEALTALARIARRQSRWKESLSLFEKAIRLSPRDPHLWLDRAWTFSMLRDYAGTWEMLERALAVAPEDESVLENQIVALQLTGKMTAARELIDRHVASAEDKKWAGARIFQLTLERRFAEAERLTEQTTEWKPPIDGGVGWQTLGWLRSLQGNEKGAREAYAKGRERLEILRREQPRNQFLVMQLAYCEAGLGNREEALRGGEKAVAMVPASEDPVYGPFAEENLAGLEAQVGETERALARIERLLVTPYGAFPLTQATLRLDPLWDPLRQHPRFRAIVEGPEPKTIYQ